MLNALTFIASLGLLGDVALHEPTDLVAAAAASGRPSECMPARSQVLARRSAVWSRARVPNLQRYCALIARAHARIDENPSEARTAAERAEKLVPGRAAPQVVLARVALSQGDTLAAEKAFDEALKRDPRGVEQPVAMHDLALSQRRRGHLTQALTTYRVLVPRAALLPDRERRARVLLEAAHVAMAVAATRPDDRSRILDEALAFLREAARDGHHRLSSDVAMSLVLALDRVGQRLQADAVLSEHQTSASWEAKAPADYLANPDDGFVLRGLALERSDPAAAAQSYRQYLEGDGGKGPYAATVRARLSGLTTTTPPKRRRRPR